jgi:hypothetical protein
LRKGRPRSTWQTIEGIAVSDTIIRLPSASNRFRRLRARGPRGMAIECAVAAFLVAFAALQILFVASATAT